MDSVFLAEPCKNKENGVSLGQEPTNLDKRIDALETGANLHTIKTRNGCTVTLIFSQEENPTIRKDVAEMLLDSLRKRSVAS